jgi:hypothetical protein
VTDYSRADMEYACRLANRAYDEDMIFRALAKKPSGRRGPGSVKYQRILDEKGRDAADDYARTTARKAIRFVIENPKIGDRADALVRLTELRAIADGLPWCTYGGPGPRRALEATFIIGERVGGIRFGLSLREWAELCGQDMRATRTHRDLLVALGWLDRNADDRLGRTARYRLRTPRHIHSHGRYECAALGDPAWLAHDAFRPEGLGDVGWYVLSRAGTQLGVSDLSVRAGIDPAALEDLLGVMVHAGLIDIDGDCRLHRVTNPIPALDGVAERRGTIGRLIADREQHRRERDAFHARGVNVRVPQGRPMTEDPIVVRIATAFAEAVAEADLERAEEWAEAAWRRADAEDRRTSRA